MTDQNPCCAGVPGCCTPTSTGQPINIGNTKRQIVIDFLFLDLTVCDR